MARGHQNASAVRMHHLADPADSARDNREARRHGLEDRIRKRLGLGRKGKQVGSGKPLGHVFGVTRESERGGEPARPHEMFERFAFGPVADELETSVREPFQNRWCRRDQRVVALAGAKIRHRDDASQFRGQGPWREPREVETVGHDRDAR